MEIGFLNQVKAILKSLVLSCTDNITIDKLNKDYRDIEGHDIPFRRLGYNNLEQFLRQIPDTLIVVGSGHSALVYFVGNEKSAHIHNMIMAQKKTKPRSRGKSNRGNVSHSNTMRSRTTGRSNNRAPTGVGNPPRRMSGQQLSAFDITSRNISTRTVTVRDIPSNYNVKASMNSNVRSSFVSPIGKNATVINVLPQPHVMNSYGCQNYISPVVPNASVGNVLPPPHVMNSNGRSNFISPIGQYASVINVLPQPSGIVQALQQMSINENVQNATQPVLHKTEAKPYNDPEINRKYQEHIKQLESLISSSCHVTVPTVKTVSFSPETKPKINTNSSVCANSTPKSAPLAGIIPPKPKIKLSEDADRILTVAPPARKCNPIEDEQIKDEDLKEKKSPPKILKNTASPANNFKKLMDIYEEDIDDLDEAVPEFAANSRVFRLDLPKYTVPYGHKIDPCEIPDEIEVGTYLGVFISEIHNPFRFWFHVHKEQHVLDILMHQIERYYTTMDANELRIPVVCLNPGQICAASFNGMWHRGEIVAPPVNNKVKVSFIDYGTVSDVDISDVKYLGSCFSTHPAQALRGCLSNIKPRGLHWSHEATTYFLSVVSELLLYAKITEIDRENKVCYMVLCNTHGDKVLQINKSLVEKKYALFNEDWQEANIQKNNGQRIRHPREDFPTFSMIESGEYPSFMELVELQQRGIDYELIYDRIIFNKYAVLNTYDNVPEPIRKLPFFLLTNNPFRADIVFELTSDMKSTI